MYASWLQNQDQSSALRHLRSVLKTISDPIFCCNAHYIGDPQMDFKDYYKILGVEPTADEKAIKAAYRKLARKVSPGMSARSATPGTSSKRPTRPMKCWSDAQKRAEVRRNSQVWRPTWPTVPGTTGLGEPRRWRRLRGRRLLKSCWLGSSVGGVPTRWWRPAAATRGAGRWRGQDVELELAVFLEETLSKESKQISFQVRKPMPWANAPASLPRP